MTEPSTDRGLPIRWWHVVALSAAAWALFAATVGVDGSLAPGVLDAVALTALLAWPAMPVAMYRDLGRIGEPAPWRPARESWLIAAAVPLANVPVGVAYCIRRIGAVRGELPSPRWRYGVYAGLLGWTAVVAADLAVEYVSLGPLEPLLFDGLLFLVWPGFPVALYLDAVRVRASTDMTPYLRVMVALAAVPAVNLLVGVAYVAGRWWYRRTADPDAAPTEPDARERGDARSGRPDPISPWYRRAAVVFAAYFLVVVALGSWLSLETDLGWNVLGLVVWPAFGVFFTACLHFDLRTVREAGVPWGDTRYLYYLSALVPAPAFYYLLSRLTKVNRARSKGLIDEDGGGSGGGNGEDGGDGDEAPAASDAASTPAPDRTHGADGTEGDGTGFEWGEGSRG